MLKNKVTGREEYKEFFEQVETLKQSGKHELAVKELEESGSIEYAKERAMHHHKIAHRCLDELEQTEYVDVLRELTDFQLVRIN